MLVMEMKMRDRCKPFTPYLRDSEEDGGNRSQEVVRGERGWRAPG